jgi:hypothetical protein
MWIFVVGIVVICLLFFIGGTLVGYSICSKQIKDSTDSTKSRHPLPNPQDILGKVIDQQAAAITSRIRTPTPTALQQAETYKQTYID